MTLNQDTQGESLCGRSRPAWLMMVLSGLLVLAAATGRAQSRDPDVPLLRIDTGVEYLIETDRPLSVEQALSAKHADRWQAIEGDVNFGFRDVFVWYRFTLDNSRSESLTRFLEIAYPLLDHVELFQHTQGNLVRHEISGDQFPHRQRPINYRHVVFPLQLEANSQNSILLRIGTSGAHRVPLRLWEPFEFEQHARDEMTLLGVLYGMMFVIGVLNLLLFLGIGQKQFLYLGGLLLLLLASMSAIHGTAYQYLYPQWPELHARMVLLSVPLMTLLLLTFSSHFLRLNRLLPRAAQLIRWLIMTTSLAVAGALVLPYVLSTYVSSALILATCMAILVSALVLAWRGNRNARFFLLAWVALLLGTMGKVLALGGIVSSPFIADYAMEFGAVGTSLIFSYVLSERFHHERRVRVADQQARIRALRHREQAERRSAQQARRHPLTGLPNRGVLEQRLHEEVAKPELLALILLHVKGFDDFNRTLGHENADTLLKHFAQRLNHHATDRCEGILIEAGDTHPCALAHMDGVTLGCAFRPSSRKEIITVMQSLARNARQPLTFHGLELSLDVVLGCAFHPDDSPDVPTLLRHAFIAYGQADADVDHMALYDEESDPYSRRRLTLMTDLNQAIRDNDLELYFQPQIRLADGEVAGFEALLRWQHPRHGFVPPDEFIPMAERAGLMRLLTEWVIDRALTFCRRLDEAGSTARLSVNISAINLRDTRFSGFVQQALENHEVDARRLVLEVTETAAMRSPEHTLATLHKLNDLGIGISIDDFGTGHSSLSYLSQLPVHEIKIDKSFVMHMDSNQNNRTIVRTTTNMCHDLGYRVIAEGVESQAALDLLESMTCDVTQGYFISHPLPEDALLAWFHARTKPAGG